MAEIAGFGKCDNKECFANVDRRCRVLHNSDFHGKDCPFFKPKGKENERWEKKQK